MNKECFVQKRNSVVFYTTATCNLKCRYCYIDKSDILVKIDKLLEDSYEGDYYFNFLKEMFPSPSQLQRVEFWGGEPSYGLPRVTNTIIKAIKYYPNLKEFMMSTNLTTNIGLQDFIDFCKIFKQFPARKFIFTLQLSLDGPVEINDTNRGKGVTQKFTEHFAKLLFQLDSLLEEVPNLEINSFFKATLDADSIAKLQTKEDIIKYYQFFENYKKMSDQYVKSSQWSFSLHAPNTATPSPHTIQDGKNFANLTKICKDIMINENWGRDYFKYIKIIMPFAEDNGMAPCSFTALTGGCGTCGSGSCILGLLPNKLISTCHSGFVDLLSDYRKKCEENLELANHSIENILFLQQGVENKAICSVEEYTEYEKQMLSFDCNSKWQISELASLIQLYANSNMIDRQYIKWGKAVEAAHFIQNHTASCVRDNMGVTGTKFLFQVGFIKLFLNGAKENIEDVERFLVSNRTK